MRQKISISWFWTEFSQRYEARLPVLSKLIISILQKSHPVDYLKCCAQLLREDGFAIVIEPTSDFEIALMAEALQGIDFNQIESNNYSRIYGVYFDRNTLERVFQEAGFRIAFRQVIFSRNKNSQHNFAQSINWRVQADPTVPTTTYAIRRIQQQPRDPVLIDIDDISEFTWIAPLQKVVKERLNEPEHKTVWITSTKVRNNGTTGLSLCFV